MRPRTRAVSAPRFAIRQAPVGLPVVNATTFELDQQVYDAVKTGVVREVHLYTRYGNPTIQAVAEKLALLEGAEDAILTASGMAAISATFFTLLRGNPGVVAPTQLYGQTQELLRRHLEPWGARVVQVDMQDLEAVEAALPEGGLLYAESLSNPLLEVSDLEGLAAVARRKKATFIVDNTFCGPSVLRPLERGADLVIESATKYLGGHSDLTCGVVAGPKALIDRIWRTNIVFGGCLDPQAAWLLDRGLRTLPLRMAAHAENALAVATFLEAHPAVRWVRFTGLPSHPHHARAARWDGQPGMVTFRLAGGDAAALRLLERLDLVRAATSLGGVESLVSLPFNTSHPSAEQQRALGLEPGTVRLSVGCEDPADLIADLATALGPEGSAD